MSSGNKKPIKHVEDPLLNKAAIIGYWWCRKGPGDDERQSLVAVTAVFELGLATLN